MNSRKAPETGDIINQFHRAAALRNPKERRPAAGRSSLKPGEFSFQEKSFKYDLFKKLSKVQVINSSQQFSLELIDYYKSNLQPVTSTTASAQDSQAVNVLPNDKLLDIDLFIDIMTLYSKIEKVIIPSVEAGELLQSLLDKHHKQHGGVEKQYAFVVVFLKHGKTVISPLYYPCNSKRNHSDSIIKDKLHSEEILIKELDHFFQNNGVNVQHVFIYTHNSPCTKREKEHIEPCMFLLRKKTDQWHNEYGFSTDVAFKVFWGRSRPKHFNYITDIPSPSSAFYPNIEKFERIPFKVDWKNFKLKPGDILKLTDVEVRKSMTRRQDIKSVFQSLKGFAETSFGLRTDYLETGEKMIEQSLKNFRDLDICINISRTLKEKWDEMVNNSFLSLIRETISADFNAAEVHLAVEDLQLGDNSPLKLHHVVDGNPYMNMLN